MILNNTSCRDLQISSLCCSISNISSASVIHFMHTHPVTCLVNLNVDPKLMAWRTQNRTRDYLISKVEHCDKADSELSQQQCLYFVNTSKVCEGTEWIHARVNWDIMRCAGEMFQVGLMRWVIYYTNLFKEGKLQEGNYSPLLAKWGLQNTCQTSYVQ